MTNHPIFHATRETFDRFAHFVNSIITTDLWISFLWIGLGLSTWLGSSQSDDIISVFGPIIVGCFKFSTPRIGSSGYYTLAFAVAADRVIGYASDEIYNPLFVWLIVGTYMAQLGVKKNGV